MKHLLLSLLILLSCNGFAQEYKMQGGIIVSITVSELNESFIVQFKDTTETHVIDYKMVKGSKIFYVIKDSNLKMVTFSYKIREVKSIKLEYNKHSVLSTPTRVVYWEHLPLK